MFSQTVGKLVNIAVIVVMLFTSGCDVEDLTPAPPDEPTIVATAIGQEDILTTNASGEMINQPKYIPSFTLSETWKITIIITIHWNEGNGAEPGQISLEDETGTVFGPWQVVGKPFNNVENVRWVAEPNQILPPGKYKVVDSDSATWANNEGSGFVGFTRVAGVRVGGSEKPPTVEPKQPEVPARNEPNLPTIPLTLVAQTAFEADGKTYKDKAGVQATVPEGSLPDGGSLLLKANQPTEEFDKALREIGLKRKSNIYKFEVNGEGDSLSDAVISFPSSPGDRVAKLVGERGLIWADDWDANGQRKVQTFIGLPGDKTSQYMLIGSLEGANAASGVVLAKYDVKLMDLGKGTYHQADLLPAAIEKEPPIIEECSLDERERYTAFWGYTCRRIKEPDSYSRVEIFSENITPKDWNANLSKVDALLLKMLEYKKIYGKIGFEKALPEANRTLCIQIKSDLESPYYDQYTGHLYFGWKQILKPDSTQKEEQTIAHELFHWIQHGSYIMRNPFLGFETLWWLDISAEVATFLINPDNLQVELGYYGTNSNNGTGHKLGFQEPPFEWMRKSENARYIHALQYYAMMNPITKTDNWCLPDELSFINTINRGDKPLTDRGAIEMKNTYRKGSGYLAKYLLNEPDANACMELKSGGILVDGRGYGDFIHASSHKTRIDKLGMKTATDNISIGNDGVATVKASIAGGGVYPLRVSNGANIPLDDDEIWKSPSVPYVLKIKASVPYFYKIGDNPMKWYDGKADLVFSPITSVNPVTVYEPDASGTPVKQEKPGIPLVRIVAYNETDTETVFQATFVPVPPVLVFDPTSLSNVVQNPDQVLNARLENLLSIVTAPVKFRFEKVMMDGWTENIAESEIAAKDGVAAVSASYKFENPDLKEVRVLATYILGDKEITIEGVIPVVSSSPTPTFTATATSTPTPTPTVTPTIPIKSSGGYWQFVKTSDIPRTYPYDDPSRDVHKTNVSEGGGSFYHKGISPDLIDFYIREFNCTWAITSPTNLEILNPGDTLVATASCTDTSKYSAAGTGSAGSNVKFAIEPPDIDAYAGDIVAFQMGFEYQEKKNTKGSLIVPAGPLGEDWNNRIAVVFNLAHAGVTQRIYEWVPLVIAPDVLE